MDDVTSVLAALTVADLEQALPWYERLFGRPADRRPMPGLAEWDVTSGGGIQVTEADPAGHGSVTLATTDLPALIATIRGRGVDVAEPTTGTGAQFVVLTDPDGNSVVLATTLPGD